MKIILPVVASFPGASPCCDLYRSTMAFAQACATRNVDREGPLEILIRGCQEGFIGHNAGGVDVDVNSAEVLDDPRDRIENLAAESDVNSVVLDFDIVL